MLTPEQLNELSMKIILHAGDARNDCYEALNDIEVGDYDAAMNKIVEAKAKITQAHQVQTSVIQSEARGESIHYSTLFAHAQDTMMSVMSEVALVKKLITIFKNMDLKISSLKGDLS